MTENSGDQPDNMRETDQYSKMVAQMRKQVNTLVQDGNLYVNINNLKELVNFIALTHRHAVATGLVAAAPDFYRGQTMITLMLMSMIDAAVENNANDVDLSAEIQEGLAEIEAMLREHGKDS